MIQGMNVLVITNMYPQRNPGSPYAGIFVKEQLEELSKLHSISLHVIDGFRGKIRYLTSIPAICRKILRGKFDIVHVHYGISALFVPFLPRKYRKRVLLSLHGGDILADQGRHVQVWLTKRLINLVGGVVVLNEAMERAVASQLHGIGRKIFRIPCGVDVDFFKPENSGKADEIVFPGNPERYVKNFPLFERIVAQYNLSYGPLSFTCLHNMSRAEVRQTLCRSSALLMTSWSEGSPQAVKEALSCDTVVVSSAVGDVSDVLRGLPGCHVFDLGEDVDTICKNLYEAIRISRATVGLRREGLLKKGLAQSDICVSISNVYKEIAFDN